LARGDNGGEFSDIIYSDATLRYEVFDGGFDRSNYPMTIVLWQGAQAYCRAIGRRLPTEAEWERAARGPNNTIYPWGQQWDPTAANTTRSGETRLGLGGTVQVDTYPNGQSLFGPFNMAGNVAEWTSDWYSATIYQERANSGQVAVNPTGPDLGEERVVRGGSWDAVPLYARTVHRRSESPGQPGPWIGFRCAADADPLATQPTNPGTSLTQPTADVPTLSPTLDPNQ
jgi:formylglycine-generating enzyme required for sulfatase activity